MIERVLAALGFQVKTVEDCVTARFAKRTRRETNDRLDQQGRLLIFTRQMDMLMCRKKGWRSHWPDAFWKPTINFADWF